MPSNLCAKTDFDGHQNWAHELCGCYCMFGECVGGCESGGAIGPGLSKNLTPPGDWNQLLLPRSSRAYCFFTIENLAVHRAPISETTIFG